MSASGVSTSGVESRADANGGGWFTGARWLAWQDMKRSWLSYPLSGLYMLFFGFIVTPSLSVSVAAGDAPAVLFFFADYLFVIFGCLMVVNAISMDYLRLFTTDVFSDRTAFLLGLPISARTLVAARMLSMLAAVPFTVPAFFVPIYLFTGLGDLGFSYVWFVGIWLGWSLFYAGVTLLCEFGLSGRSYCWLSFAIIASLVVVVIMIEALSDLSLVGASSSLASDYGPLPALASVALGAAGFWLLSRLTVRRIQGREVGA